MAETPRPREWPQPQARLRSSPSAQLTVPAVLRTGPLLALPTLPASHAARPPCPGCPPSPPHTGTVHSEPTPHFTVTLRRTGVLQPPLQPLPPMAQSPQGSSEAGPGNPSATPPLPARSAPSSFCSGDLSPAPVAARPLASPALGQGRPCDTPSPACIRNSPLDAGQMEVSGAPETNTPGAAPTDGGSLECVSPLIPMPTVSPMML